MAAAQDYYLENFLVERLLAEMAHTARMIDEGIPLKKPKVFDYITDIDARREIFYQIKKIQDDGNIPLGLNAVGLAIILVAPIDKLQREIDYINMSTCPFNAFPAASLFGTMHADGVLGIKACEFLNSNKKPPPPVLTPLLRCVVTSSVLLTSVSISR